MSMTNSSQAASGGVRVKGYSPWVWALRRTIIGIVILTVTIGAAAWLLNAAIDQDAEASTEAQAALRKTTVLETPVARPTATKTGALVAH